MTRGRSYLFAQASFYLVVAITFVYIVFPFYWAFRSWITPNGELFVTPVHYWPVRPTLTHHEQARNDPQFLYAIRNSTIAASTTMLSLAMGTLGGYALGRFRFVGRRPVMYLILSMTMFLSIAILASLFDMVRRLGLYNNLLSLVITYLVFMLPLTAWVLNTFFRGLPKGTRRSGLRRRGNALSDVVPGDAAARGAWPGYGRPAAFIAAWNEFLFAVSFLQTPDKRTVPLAIFLFATSSGSGYEIPWGAIMAGTVIVTAPLILLVLVFQNRIISGLTAGAVKG